MTPESREEIQAIVELCKKEEIPYSVIGNGSNLLVGDKGYRGVILQIFKKMNQIRVEAVSYTHLDVYKRQVVRQALPRVYSMHLEQRLM